MRIYSYNVNGIRAAISKGLGDWMLKENPDILCFQELKAQEDQIDTNLFEQMGYQGFYFPAQKKGYSGVGILTRTAPICVEKGMGHSLFDSEGRVIRADYEHFSLICAYIPSGSSGDVRQEVKMQFLEAFTQYCNQQRKLHKNLVICGDFNICREAIDINHPERQEGVSGFLPEERAWFKELLAQGYVDSFREKDQRAEQYSWWSYRAGARKRNAGWRIDYHLVTESLRNNIAAARILQEAVHSDHCPVMVELNV